MLAQGWLHDGLPNRLGVLLINRCSRPQALQLLLGLWYCLHRMLGQGRLHIKVQRRRGVQVHRQRGQAHVQPVQ